MDPWLAGPQWIQRSGSAQNKRRFTTNHQLGSFVFREQTAPTRFYRSKIPSFVHTADQPIAMHQPNTAKLADILDRVLAKGVAVTGDVTLSVADVDLVYLGLRLMLSSVGTLEREAGATTITYPLLTPTEEPGQRPSQQLQGQGLDRAAALAPLADQRINADPENASKSLVQLVLTITNLLRELMEKQAMRRVDSGQLTDAQVERLGTTFMLLEQRMQDLKDYFGLQDRDLDLGLPIGDL